MPRTARATIGLEMAKLMTERSTCERGKVGCVILDEGRVICTGYNGAPSGMPHCTEVGCEVVHEGCERTLHAEAGAISFAARKGVKLEGTTLICTHAPCYDCAKLIINAGIKEVYYERFYRDYRGMALLDDAGIRIVRLINGKWEDENQV